ncbi:host cell division inhibitor Icd-like protein [Escherichia coli]|uniref:host cell division inhibitor Icd-like protein n=2 Tax=Escherichia coli TaxID=562 RepID=UPI0039066FF1
MNPALLSPSSFTDSMPSITSCGIRAVSDCDFAFFEPVAICNPLNGSVRQYTHKKAYIKALTCKPPINKVTYTLLMQGAETTKPGSARTLTGLLTKPLTGVTIMAGTQHTQTHPKFIYTFLAVHRDCMADGKNTVHVAADTLVDACEMLNDMGYISATWKGREENTLFIQKCENNFIWRFIALSTAQPRVIHIEATSEQEARQQSPDGCVMVFAARIRQEVHHA